MSQPIHPDTERLNWIESMSAEVLIPKTEALMATGFYVNTPLTGWVAGDNLREAIDNARRSLTDTKT